jgi:hypothetical protein
MRAVGGRTLHGKAAREVYLFFESRGQAYFSDTEAKSRTQIAAHPDAVGTRWLAARERLARSRLTEARPQSRRIRVALQLNQHEVAQSDRITLTVLRVFDDLLGDNRCARVGAINDV